MSREIRRDKKQRKKIVVVTMMEHNPDSLLKVMYVEIRKLVSNLFSSTDTLKTLLEPFI